MVNSTCCSCVLPPKKKYENIANLRSANSIESLFSVFFLQPFELLHSFDAVLPLWCLLLINFNESALLSLLCFW
ncbi:CLUMA_CG004057, isoform A [Clunio marinus]|uniref:CLUMA_CG004057, isoform A n=1 Tax=Clunio marinus TaxID=568069 RepID=A0A1J1HQE7_9DIPT|nr:CLUMA_CG004057, isoform A [Clunio marinus]